MYTSIKLPDKYALYRKLLTEIFLNRTDRISAGKTA
jgi:hypothetical protein